MMPETEDYIDSLVWFHKDAMALLTDLVDYPYYEFRGERNRLKKLTQIETLLAQGKEIEVGENCTSTDPTNHQGDTCPVHE
tara:strand:- start:140 stop:382 length:243 start_codon:yes stop_codon:yes gene_type:complete